MIKKPHIDHGIGFDWDKASVDYAKYRDIYPDEFYLKLIDLHLCDKDMHVLDIGTGTGVLPRNLYDTKAKFIGIDNASQQIAHAKELAKKAGMDIPFFCIPAEQIDSLHHSFDTVLACQCFTYFDHDILAKILSEVLNENGRFAILYMAWLPFEDKIAGMSEDLILSYHPQWTGCKEVRHAIEIPQVYDHYFEKEHEEVFDLRVPFTKDRWNGRIKSCRGVDASLSEVDIIRFDEEHRAMLDAIAPENFDVLHYVAITVLKKKTKS